MCCSKFTSNGDSRMNFAFLLLRAAALILTILPLASAAFAADGQILFDHDKVMAGGITPGDGPGYPATLSVPGSYKLTGNLKPPSNRDGVIADGVEITIDLNGFRIDGTNVANNGIVGKQRNLTVRNGTVQRFRARPRHPRFRFDYRKHAGVRKWRRHRRKRRLCANIGQHVGQHQEFAIYCSRHAMSKATTSPKPAGLVW